MTDLKSLKVKLFADGADLAGMKEMAANPLIKGFTTNPTLMRKAGVTDYEAFAREVLQAIPDRPVSFEVFADDFARWSSRRSRSRPGARTSTSRSRSRTRSASSAGPLVERLSKAGVQLNVTAL